MSEEENLVPGFGRPHLTASIRHCLFVYSSGTLAPPVSVFPTVNLNTRSGLALEPILQGPSPSISPSISLR
jgi:hypothetical protein